MARYLRAWAAAGLLSSFLVPVGPASGATMRPAPRLKPVSRRVAEPVRVYRFVLLGPLTAARSAAAVIVDVSDHCWTAREFGFVEVALPEGAGPNLAASGGIACWNEAAARFDALALEP